MEKLGNLQQSWAQGYNGGRVCYVASDMFFYQCGNNIKFVGEDGKETLFAFPGKGVGPFAVQFVGRYLAVSEMCINPKIYVFVYPTFRDISVIQNGAKLEYLQLFFSNSDFLGTLSGIPDFQLTFWSFLDGRKLSTFSMPNTSIPTSISFNPVNWRQICVTSEMYLTLLNIEQCNKQYIMQPVQVLLPPLNPDADEKQIRNDSVPVHASLDKPDFHINVPKSAIAGLVGDIADNLENVQRHIERVKPLSHVWNPIGDIYVGCKEGHLLKVDGETQVCQVIYCPPGSRKHSVGIQGEAAPGSRKHSSGIQNEVVPGSRKHSIGIHGEVAPGSRKHSIGIHGEVAPGSRKHSIGIHGEAAQGSRKHSIGIHGEAAPGSRKHSIGIHGEAAPGSRKHSIGIQEEAGTDSHQSSQQGNELLMEGSVSCIGLHRNGLYCAGETGTLHLIDVKSRHLHIKEQCHVGVPITHMTFSPSYERILLGSYKGTIHLYVPGDPQSLKILKNLHYGPIVGIACLPDTQYIVTCREHGEVQVWTIDTGTVISTYSLATQVTLLTCSPLIGLCAVGTVEGCICFLDLSNNVEEPPLPRLIQKVKLFQGPVTHVVFEDNGTYLLSASDDGNVFLIDGHASSGFKPLAYTEVPGIIQALTTFTDVAGILHVAVTHNTAGNQENGATSLTFFEIADRLMKDLRSNCNSLKYDFKDKSIKKISVQMAVPVYGAAFAEGLNLYTIARSNYKIHLYSLQKLEVLQSKPEFEHFKLESTAEYAGHQLNGGQVVLTPHKKWLASYGPDGTVTFRTLTQMNNVVAISPHDNRSGGVRVLAISEDNSNIFTTGYDGVLVCYTWNFTPLAVEKAKSGIDTVLLRKSKMSPFVQDEIEYLKTMDVLKPQLTSHAVIEKSLSREEKEKALRKSAKSRDEIYRTPTPVAEENATWLQIQELEAFKEENKQYAPVKRKLRSSIRDMRRKIQTMLHSNEKLPEVERLTRDEFDLDIEEWMRLQHETDLEVARVQEEIEFDNLAKMYLTEMIKQECWDDMMTKGRAVLAFTSHLEVSNFPLMERSNEVKKMVEIVSRRREIEIAEAKARKEIVEIVAKPCSTSILGNDDELDNGEDDNKRELLSTSGSLGCLFGGGNELFYSQFELHTREQKIAQIVLLEDAIHKIKMVFNKEFDDLFAQKEQEIGRIKERNKHIRKVLADLELAEHIIEPSMGFAEKPETLLTVEDSEVKVEKYFTPEYVKFMEKKKKEEEEKRAHEKGDNAHQRALNDMMGGVLEIKKEDELKRDPAKPAFMTLTADDHWTEEEQKIAKDYEKCVKELQEEREKYRKQLETELRKSQSLIHEGMAAFDDMLYKVFMKKIKVVMVTYQEELKILRMRYSLMIDEELQTRELDLKLKLDQKKQLRQLALQTVLTIRKYVDAFKEKYDNMLAEDKVKDKTFKREFSDLSAVQQDTLYRLFKKRPKVVKIIKAEGESSFPYPFADHPSTVCQNAQVTAHFEGAMEELDRTTNCPDIVEKHIWDRLCILRRQKVDSENLVKMNAQTLASMTDFLQRREREEETLKTDTEALVNQLDRLRRDRALFTRDLEVQLMLKQGQVEVEVGPFIYEYTDNVLLHRKVVEDLNSIIKHRGESKIASMVECKDFRKGIIQLEWEHKKRIMLMEDLQHKKKDIQYMKVTREIQLYLKSKDFDARIADDIRKLEQRYFQQKKIFEKLAEDKVSTADDVDKTIKQRDVDNNQLLNDIEVINYDCHERQRIAKAIGYHRDILATEERYKDTIQRWKLVNLAKAQAHEVDVLRSEVERLRMHTFPALLQK